MVASLPNVGTVSNLDWRIFVPEGSADNKIFHREKFPSLAFLQK
jgi:hypothetical protein